ncbi:MAG: hypothetical protein B7X40_10265 [Cellulomonas sp. 14-74-6]|nr:MAG: hypothetical protein B7X40_10265 [Cellulomonas sp. 14-74-6]
MPLFRRTPRPSGGTLIPTPFGSVEDEGSGPTPPDVTPGVVEELNDAERLWTAQQRELLLELCDAVVDAPTVGRLFDRVHTAWRATVRPADPDLLVNVFGVALGDLIAQRVPGLSWAVYRDDVGTELVLAHASHPLVVFPVAAVAERWGTAEPGWFAGYVAEAARLSSAVLDPASDAVPWNEQGPDQEGRDHHGQGDEPQDGTPDDERHR